MKSHQLRKEFIDFFTQKGHTLLPSSSLVPHKDPTLLFTNAGMVQFKERFLGILKDDINRAVTVQRCVRAGGKHNDLENVGYTARHHTFFEMLGNFSFGDYFKLEAIESAWQFLTEVLRLPQEKLWVTVHVDDKESEKIWLKQVGVNPNRFSRLDEDNFWRMGPTGPCGPCTEIFYDHGPDIAGDPPGGANEGDRYIEVWNLVFMQFNQKADGSTTELPKPCVDTGMGLERMSAVLQKVHSNYQIDVFAQLTDVIKQLAKTPNVFSLQVIADHIRSSTFMVADGVEPSRDGRGYVLRRIIRRALNHGRKMEIEGVFFHKLAAVVIDQMKEPYPYLLDNKKHIQQVLLEEEQRFSQTLTRGLLFLEKHFIANKNADIDGALAFKLFDTYGFPLDITNDIAVDRGVAVNVEKYQVLMQQQRARAQAAQKFSSNQSLAIDVSTQPTEFIGYQFFQTTTDIVAIFNADYSIVLKAKVDEKVFVLLKKTPFYAEAGGQVADRGSMSSAEAELQVFDCQKQGGYYLHSCKVTRGTIATGDEVAVAIDKEERRALCANHSATHLLHAALRKTLGDRVQQKGSLVDSKKLRFDFQYLKALTETQIREINEEVNGQIWQNSKVETREMPIQKAIDSGALALFGEKYENNVRVLTMGQNVDESDFSVELCGGTHCKQTGDIGAFVIVSESSISSGVRRIEALTRQAATKYFLDQQSRVGRIRKSLKAGDSQIVIEIDRLQKTANAYKSLQQKQREAEALQQAKKLVEQAKIHSGVAIVVTAIEGASMKQLLTISEHIQSQREQIVLLLASVVADKTSLLCKVSLNEDRGLSAKDLLLTFAEANGGKGGGKKNMAQGSIAVLPDIDKQLQRLKKQIINTING